MKYWICLANILCFLGLYFFATAGLAVFRTHSISISAEIVKSDAGQNLNRPWLEKLVSTTGNTRFYYRTMADIGVLGASLNTIAIITAMWISKRKRDGVVNAVRS